MQSTARFLLTTVDDQHTFNEITPIIMILYIAHRHTRTHTQYTHAQDRLAHNTRTHKHLLSAAPPAARFSCNS